MDILHIYKSPNSKLNMKKTKQKKNTLILENINKHKQKYLFELLGFSDKFLKFLVTLTQNF